MNRTMFDLLFLLVNKNQWNSLFKNIIKYKRNVFLQVLLLDNIFLKSINLLFKLSTLIVAPNFLIQNDSFIISQVDQFCNHSTSNTNKISFFLQMIVPNKTEQQSLGVKFFLNHFYYLIFSFTFLSVLFASFSFHKHQKKR